MRKGKEAERGEGETESQLKENLGERDKLRVFDLHFFRLTSFGKVGSR